jgi:hypothetical protein
MIKKLLHTAAFISCFLGISSITGCTDGIYTPRGYIPEETDEDQTPSPEAQPAQPQKAPTPAFIDRILHENDMVVPPPPPPPPKPAPKKPAPDLLDAS